MTTPAPIAARRIPDRQRAKYAGKLFGPRFIYVESFVFDTASSLSTAYDGGHWTFYALSNGGFYFSPDSPALFPVSAFNGYEGVLSRDAFGIACCMSAYSLLSFNPDKQLSKNSADQFHRLREFLMSHPEAQQILAVLD